MRRVLPEWYQQGNSAPNVDAIKDEFEEDEKEFLVQQKLASHIMDKKVDVSDFIIQKGIRSTRHFESERRSLEERCISLMGLMFYLDGTRNADVYPFLPESEKEIIQNDRMLDESVEREISHRRIISNFIEKYAHAPECVALWLQDKMSELKLDIAPEQFLQISAFLSSDASEIDFYALKDSNKSLHNLIKYFINPLFSNFSSEEKEYLLELSASSTPFEFIEEFSQVASNYLGDKVDSKDLSHFNTDIKKFVRRWILKNNDGHFIERVSQILGNKEESLHEDSGIIDSVIDDVNKSAQEQEEEFSENSLPAWQVNLISNYDIDKISAISGDDLDELAEGLDERFVQTGQAFSIKTSSIVDALDWFIRIPDNILEMWPKETINGVDYYKVKRGKVRIFNRMNRADRVISFFPYQKKSWEYRFRAG